MISLVIIVLEIFHYCVIALKFSCKIQFLSYFCFSQVKYFKYINDFLPYMGLPRINVSKIIMVPESYHTRCVNCELLFTCKKLKRKLIPS